LYENKTTYTFTSLIISWIIFFILKKRFLLFVLLMPGLILSLMFCKKGEPGDTGRDGTSVLPGAGIPSTAIGKVGDFFIDTAGKVLWGPKNATNWGAGAALVGPQGLPGKTVINGAGAPAAALGAVGDFYINVTAKAIYGPKTALGWGAATSLIGPTGAQGIQGNPGTPAQVIYSPWITSPYSSRDTVIDGTCLRIRHLDAPSLSTAILNQGVMITYMRVGSIGPYQLPYTSDAGGATNTVNCIYNQNKIFVYRHTFNTCRFNSGIAEAYPGQPVLINLPQSLEYRYVLIPGLIAGGRMASGSATDLHKLILAGHSLPAGITTMSYEKVCSLLGIQQ
jgi:hypothetical protein